MEIKKFNESIIYEEKVVLDAILEIIKPWNEQLKYQQNQIAAYGTNAVFSMNNGIDGDTSKDFIDIFNALNKFGLDWHIDYVTIAKLGWNTICMIVNLNKYNDELSILINAKKYNL